MKHDWDPLYEKYEQKRRAKARMGSDQVHQDLYYKFKQENRWTMFGKYYGTPIDQLPQSYLVWVTENLNGKYKEFAEKELFRRKSSNT
jgi:hypothetical protein